MHDSDPQVDQYSKRLGGTMIVVAWVLILLMLVWLFDGVLERQYNPNAQLGAAISSTGNNEVVLERNRYGHYVASGMINGESVVFLLDTGATDVAVSEELADRLGLRRGMPGMSQTANGSVRSWSSRLESVALGSIRLQNVRASILPGAGFDEGEVLLGMSFLKQLEMVQKGDTLTLRQLAPEAVGK